MKNSAIGASIIIILAAIFFFFSNTNKQSQTSQPATIESSEPNQSVSGYTGKVLAGTSSPFLEFNKVDYQKALSENKIIILNFYANWCPICRGEEGAIHAGFDGLSEDKIIGFRVNFNDSDTDADEEVLAKELNILYQHTKVILKNGKEFSRSPDSWTKETFDTEIAKALQ